MPFLDDGDLRIHYEVIGEGPPVLLIAPGGMRSSIDRWSASPWNPVELLPASHTVIAMDQRNAGDSTAPVIGDDGWDTYRRDQIALLDHLGVERCSVMGMCIGGPYIMGLLAHETARFDRAILLQPVGVDDTNRQSFYDMFDDWAGELRSSTHGDVPPDVWRSFRSNMWDTDFVATVDHDQARRIETPVLIARGEDHYHPPWTSDQLHDDLASSRLISDWKTPEAFDRVDDEIRTFLTA